MDMGVAMAVRVQMRIGRRGLGRTVRMRKPEGMRADMRLVVRDRRWISHARPIAQHGPDDIHPAEQHEADG